MPRELWSSSVWGLGRYRSLASGVGMAFLSKPVAYDYGQLTCKDWMQRFWVFSVMWWMQATWNTRGLAWCSASMSRLQRSWTNSRRNSDSWLSPIHRQAKCFGLACKWRSCMCSWWSTSKPRTRKFSISHRRLISLSIALFIQVCAAFNQCLATLGHSGLFFFVLFSGLDLQGTRSLWRTLCKIPYCCAPRMQTASLARPDMIYSIWYRYEVYGT